MPYHIVKVKGGYSLRNKDNGNVHSKHTSLAKAQAQMRLLEGIEHGSIKRGSKMNKHSGGTRNVRNMPMG